MIITGVPSIPPPTPGAGNYQAGGLGYYQRWFRGPLFQHVKLTGLRAGMGDVCVDPDGNPIDCGTGAPISSGGGATPCFDASGSPIDCGSGLPTTTGQCFAPDTQQYGPCGTPGFVPVATSVSATGDNPTGAPSGCLNGSGPLGPGQVYCPVAPITGGAAIKGSPSGGYTIQGANGSQSLTAAQAAALISQLGQSATSVYKSTLSPYQIPGTSLVYNPSTGQILTGTGTGTGSGSGAGSTIAGIPVSLLLIGAAAFILMSGKR